MSCCHPYTGGNDLRRKSPALEVVSDPFFVSDDLPRTKHFFFACENHQKMFTISINIHVLIKSPGFKKNNQVTFISKKCHKFTIGDSRHRAIQIHLQHHQFHLGVLDEKIAQNSAQNLENS